MRGQKEIAARLSWSLRFIFLPNDFFVPKFHRSKLVIVQKIWSAATCRRFPTHVAQRLFKSCPLLKTKAAPPQTKAATSRRTPNAARLAAR
jgi:hypothetical protein